MGGGRSGIQSRGGAYSNTFQSSFGFPNVGTRESFSSIGGGGTRGTVTPSTDDVQKYLDTGRFDGYGTSASAKNTMAKAIARDMNGRGFEVTVSEDGTHLLPNGDTGKSITLGRSGGKWKAKQSTSSGSRNPGGMKGALRRAGSRR